MNGIVPATEMETTAMLALKGCRFLPMSWDKRFVQNLKPTGISERERAQLWRLLGKYRRQVLENLLRHKDGKARQAARAEFATLAHHAAIYAAPDFRLVNAKTAAGEAARLKMGAAKV